MEKNIWFALIGSVALLCSGCFSLERETPDIKHYSFNVVRDQVTVKEENGLNVMFKGIDIQSIYQGRSFMYRDAQLRFIKDFYHQFMLDPSRLITEQATAWFAAAPYVNVLDYRRTTVKPDIEIYGIITKLYTDIRDKNAPVAHLAIRFRVVDMRIMPYAILYEHDYPEERTVMRFSATEIMNGFNDALRSVLEAFEADLGEKLGIYRS
ncbi:MAG: hypothetical protein JW938_07910 [Candidatus Omnitrophica bacterium]|nr:hypothetical protein [Candidatus Omnitrophota bacterium]